MSIDDQLFASGLYDTLTDLDDDERNAWILCELRGLPYREAAALLGVTHPTAITRRERAANSIREELSV